MKLIPMLLLMILLYAGYLLLEEEVVDDSKKLYVSVLRSDGNVELELEEYVVQVVGSEMPATFDEEALKAQAVASRTYVMSRDLTVDDSTKTQVFQSDEQFRIKWKDAYEENIEKIRAAVAATYGEVIAYDGQYARALFFSCSNGKTANSNEYYSRLFPYLVTVESPYDQQVNPNFEKKVEIEKKTIVEKLEDWEIEVLSWYDSGYVKQVRVGNTVMSGKEVREKLGLRSSCFEVLTKKDTVVFITYGSGHGVGMSQYGAHGMAKNGYTYEQILKHYYTGVELVNVYE